MKNEIFSMSGGFSCQSGEFFFSFVCISPASEKKGNERGKLNWLLFGNMGGISSNFISYNFNLGLAALF